MPVRLRVAPGDLREPSNRIELELVAADDPKIRVREAARFLGPRPEPERDDDDSDDTDRSGGKREGS